MAKGQSKIRRAYDLFMSGMEIEGEIVVEPNCAQVARAVHTHPQYVRNVAKREGWAEKRGEIHDKLAVKSEDAELDYQHEIYRQKRREFLLQEENFLRQVSEKFQRQAMAGERDIRGYRDYNAISQRRDKILEELAGQDGTPQENFTRMMIQLGIIVQTGEKETIPVVEAEGRLIEEE